MRCSHTDMHHKRCSVFLVGEESLRVHESDSELKGRVGRGLDHERGKRETWNRIE